MRIAALALGVSLLLVSAGQAQDVAANPVIPTSTVAPLAEGEAKVLQAVIMEVTGKVRWRAGDDAPWKSAQVNDVLDVGAEIRTAIRSSAGLRVGMNATLLVESGTTLIVPEIVQEGSTLRTRAMVKSGRVNFKVDQVGLTNDFQVVTPSMALAVRGTGFGVDYGGLTGTQITGLPDNTMDAMVIRYFLLNLQVVMGNGKSADGTPDPATGAWLETVGVPVLLGEVASAEEFQQLLENGFAIAGGVFEQKDVQYAAEGLDNTTESAGGEGEPEPPVTEEPPPATCPDQCKKKCCCCKGKGGDGYCYDDYGCCEDDGGGQGEEMGDGCECCCEHADDGCVLAGEGDSEDGDGGGGAMIGEFTEQVEEFAARIRQDFRGAPVEQTNVSGPDLSWNMVDYDPSSDVPVARSAPEVVARAGAAHPSRPLHSIKTAGRTSRPKVDPVRSVHGADAPATDHGSAGRSGSVARTRR
jgi:hypothetical protein